MFALVLSGGFMLRRRVLPAVLLFAALGRPALAQDSPYFVTYDHYLEEKGNLEVAVANTGGLPRAGRSAYNAPWLELEYGLAGWWTAEFYMEGVSTVRDGSGFTGWRWENRFRPLQGEHRFNPVLYVEYEHTNEASRIQKEIVGGGPLEFEPISHLRRTSTNELEGKLILSSAARSWNISENFIVEKNLSEDEGLEFGYSVGVSRSLGALASGESCRVCRENFVAGVEAYGALGSTQQAGLSETRHYVAPVLAWRATPRSTFKASVGFGVTQASDRYLVRVGWAYELPLRAPKGGR
jgi:hypothetical protein